LANLPWWGFSGLRYCATAGALGGPAVSAASGAIGGIAGYAVPVALEVALE